MLFIGTRSGVSFCSLFVILLWILFCVIGIAVMVGVCYWWCGICLFVIVVLCGLEV